MIQTGTKIGVAGLALLSGLALSSAAHAGKTASQQIGVRASVPSSCEIVASPVLASVGAGFSRGSVFESCNTQEGFQVIAQHRTLESSEQVAFNYAGETRRLRSDGWSPVANRLGAKFGRRFIGVRHTGLMAPLAIGLTITAF